MALQEDYNALKRLLEALNIANDSLQKKNSALMEENTMILKSLINCQNALDINKEIMRNALTEQNKIKDESTIEIKNLENKIKGLENGDNH